MIKVRVVKVVEQKSIFDDNGNFKGYKESAEHEVNDLHNYTNENDLRSYYNNKYGCDSCLISKFIYYE